MSDDTSRIIPFPQSRVPGGSMKRPAKELGLTPLARQIDSGGRGVGGHWCSRCQGIWYGYFLETECPVCGNRHG